jgi:predicted nucleotidyltransferase
MSAVMLPEPLVPSPGCPAVERARRVIATADFARRTVDARLARVLARPERIAAAYAFGSAAREEARAMSDLDVGVLFAAPPLRSRAMYFALLPVLLEYRRRRGYR